MHKGWVLSFISVCILSACSPSSVFKNLGLQPGNDKPEENKPCPATVYPTKYEIGVLTSEEIPKTLGVVLDGKLKYNECLDEPNTDLSPAVAVETEMGVINIKVTEEEALEELPGSVNIQILDMRNCRNTPTRFFTYEKLPLEFKADYPDGEHCAPLTHAEVTVIK